MKPSRALFPTKFAFFIVDKTHSGKVSFDEIFQVMAPLIGTSSATTIDCMQFFFSLCDLDNDSMLNIDEFYHFLSCYNICCERGFIKIKADLIIVLFIEMFRAIDSDMNGTVCCSEIAHAIQRLEDSNATMFGYKEMFMDIRDYCVTKGASTELTEFEFLCISIKPEILFMHLEAKYTELFNQIDKENKGFIHCKELQGLLINILFPRGCETKNAIDLLTSVIVHTTHSDKIKLNQFGFLVELLKDVSHGSTFLTNSMLFEALFRLIDNNSNGELDGDELTLLVNAINLSPKKRRVVLDVFKQLRTLTYNDFIHLMQD